MQFFIGTGHFILYRIPSQLAALGRWPVYTYAYRCRNGVCRRGGGGEVRAQTSAQLKCVWARNEGKEQV